MNKNDVKKKKKKKKKSVNIRDECLIFVTFLEILTQWAPLPSDVTHFARDPLRSYFDECHKMKFISQNDHTKGVVFRIFYASTTTAGTENLSY